MMEASDISRLIVQENGEDSIINSNSEENHSDMTNYYRSRAEAEAHRRKGERIYYEPGPGKGFYIVRPQRRDPWRIF